jgi:prevent-host-death family protein
MANLNNTLLANEARDNFYQILEEADTKLRQFTITLRGKAKAVIMSAEEYAGWLETLELMTDKATIKRIDLGQKELKAGKGIAWEKVKQQLKW